MEKLYYIKRLDELKDLLRGIFYDLDDNEKLKPARLKAIKKIKDSKLRSSKLKTISPSLENYREGLESKKAFLQYLKKDFPDYSGHVDTAWNDIKDGRDKLANNNILAKDLFSDALHSLHALTMALTEKKKIEVGSKQRGRKPDPMADEIITRAEKLRAEGISWKECASKIYSETKNPRCKGANAGNNLSKFYKRNRQNRT